MPFYLVNHTSLIEADNEQAAAEKVLENMGSGDVRFSVKYDDNVTQVLLKTKSSAMEKADADEEVLPESLREDEVVGPIGRGERAIHSSRSWTRGPTPAAFAVLVLGISIGLMIA